MEETVDQNLTLTCLSSLSYTYNEQKLRIAAKIIRGKLMIIRRDKYLKKLIDKRGNGLVKIITGIRRCGKSFLLFNLFHEYLNSIGVPDENIIELSLDEALNARYRNPLELDKYIRDRITDSSRQYYVFLDEIQKVLDIQNPYIEDKSAKIGFIDVLLGLMKIRNVDIYVTGSNSKMLSSDILTEFRGRGDEIRVNPLTYKEFLSAYVGEQRLAWEEYCTYGGMPFALSLKTHEEKSKYLKDLCDKTYIDDVLERHKITNDKSVLGSLLDITASSVGSLTNPSKLSNTFRSEAKVQISPNTIGRYLDFFIDAFIMRSARRYDVKGKKYINSLEKFYFTDIGLRNARLNFRQQEKNHIMENIIFNELMSREFNVDIGMVEYNHLDALGKKVRTQLEIDFVANKGSVRYYIQSAFSIGDEGKRRQETNSLIRVPDSFKKIVVVKDPIIPWHDEKGILYVGIERFLLDESAMEL